MGFDFFEDEFMVSTQSDTDIHDISNNVIQILARSGVMNGVVVVFTPGSTAAITAIEFESGAVHDLRQAIARLAPSDDFYKHNERWGDGNGYSHVRSALLGPSMSVPVSNGRLVTGTWQQIVLCDFDNRPRQRRVHVTVLGQTH